MSRLNQILAIILGLQLIVAGFIFWPQPTAPAGGGPLLPDFQPDKVTQLTITDGEGKHLVLARQEESWVLPEADDFPADAARVIPLLDKIKQVETNRLVAQTDASHRQLQVAGDEFNRQIELKTEDGATHTLYLGSSGGVNATHVRTGGQSQVYLADGLSAWDADPQPASWIDTLYFTVPQTAPVALSLTNSNGTFEFAKEGEVWAMKGLTETETLDPNKLTALVNQVASIRMNAPIGKTAQESFELSAPQAVITLTTLITATGETNSYTLRVGAQDTDNNYILASSASPYYVLIAQFTGDALVKKTRADFLVGPPGAGGPGIIPGVVPEMPVGGQ
jgi:hypothetical protein